MRGPGWLVKMEHPVRGSIAILSVCLALLMMGFPAATARSPAVAPSGRTAPGLPAPADALAEALPPIPGDASGTQRERVLLAAETVFAQRAADSSHEFAALLGQEQRNLRTSRDLLRIVDQQGDRDQLAWSVEAAKVAMRHQAATVGLAWNAPVPLIGFTRPSQAILVLVDRTGVDLAPAQRDAVYALDALSEPLRGALARFVDAFLALDAATRLAYAHADFGALAGREVQVLRSEISTASWARGLVSPALLPGEVLKEAGVDLSLVFPTRAQFLHEVLALRDALAAFGSGEVSVTGGTLDLCPAVALELAGDDSLYDDDCVLVLDLGGSDKYYNNAGGNGLNTMDPCPLEDLAGPRVAAALVDFGTGADAYGNPAAPRACGVNGGARFGAGFLMDSGGNDMYVATDSGTNGAGDLGAGFLLDIAGNDAYTGTSGGTNGGGNVGVGLLLDITGDDAYTGTYGGVNGGGSRSAGGFLFDASGNDVYIAAGQGANGGGYVLGAGFLLDSSGNDAYTATNGGAGANGGAAGGTYCFIVVLGCVPVPGAVGLLLDGGGTDNYADSSGGTGMDKTVVPKGILGAQLDSDDPPL